MGNKEELATKLRAEEGEGFKALLAEAGLNTNFEVLEQLDADSDKRVTWDKFYGKLKEAAKAEIRATGDVTAATEIKIEDDGTSTAATEAKGEVKIEDEHVSPQMGRFFLFRSINVVSGLLLRCAMEKQC